MRVVVLRHFSTNLFLNLELYVKLPENCDLKYGTTIRFNGSGMHGDLTIEQCPGHSQEFETVVKKAIELAFKND